MIIIERPYTVAIDPGHQRRGNPTQEPIGPGSTNTKDRVAPVMRGVYSGLAEYEGRPSVA